MDESTRTKTRISWIVFDLGGVVCQYDTARRYQLLASSAGSTPERMELPREYGDAFDRGQLSSRQWHSLHQEVLGVKISFSELQEAYVSAFKPDDEVLQIVDSVRRLVSTALFTNNAPILHEAMPRAFPEVVARFDRMIFTYMLGHTKPAAEAFSGAIDMLGVPSDEIIFVDDSPANVDAGARAGMKAVRHTSPTATRQAIEEYLGTPLPFY